MTVVAYRYEACFPFVRLGTSPGQWGDALPKEEMVLRHKNQRGNLGDLPLGINCESIVPERRAGHAPKASYFL